MPSDLVGWTLSQALRRQRDVHPGKTFIAARETRVTYGEAAATVDRLAAFLHAAGVRPGDRVCLLLPRVPELVLTLLGAARIGALAVPVNPAPGPDAVRSFVAAAAPAAVVAHARILRQLGMDTCGRPARVAIAVGGEVNGWVPWPDAAGHAGEPPADQAGPDDTAYLNYTTGSSGEPKGALATHANIAWNTLSSVETFGIDADDVHLCMFAPFAHPHELFARALYTGGSLVLLEEISPRTIARTIRDQGVTCMMGLAPMYDMLLAHAAGSGLGRLRIAESGGMYTRPDTVLGFQRAFGIPVLSVWGSTETSGIAIANTPGEYRADGSAGRACPHYGVRVVDVAGGDVPDGEIGELVFSGPGVVAGYREGTALPEFDGWYRSGDLARREAGWHYFVERASGLLKVAGLKVYPLQVELALQAHPSVREAAVVGVGDRLRGVVPKAFVVLREGAVVDPEDLRRFCRAALADYMVPREIEVLEDLPRIGSGKPDKRALAVMSNGPPP